jgi:DNA-binding transcriptional MerR regulator
MKFGFTTRQVTHLTGVPYSTLNLWAKSGLVVPTIAESAGTGSERVYSFSDLLALKVAFKLRESGISTHSLKKVVEFLRENERMKVPLAEARLVVSGRDVLLVRNERELVSALAKPGQSCLSFVVDLPRTLGELVQIADQETAFAIGVLPPEDARSAGMKKRPSAASAAHKPSKRVRK